MASIGSKFIRLIWQGLKKENRFKRNLIMPMKFWTKLLIVLRNHLRYDIFYDLRRFNLRLKVILNWYSIFWGFNCIFVERRTRPLIWVPTRRGFEIQKNHYLTSKKLKILFLKFYFVGKKRAGILFCVKFCDLFISDIKKSKKFEQKLKKTFLILKLKNKFKVRFFFDVFSGIDVVDDVRRALANSSVVYGNQCSN